MALDDHNWVCLCDIVLETPCSVCVRECASECLPNKGSSRHRRGASKAASNLQQSPEAATAEATLANRSQLTGTRFICNLQTTNTAS